MTTAILETKSAPDEVKSALDELRQAAGKVGEIDGIKQTVADLGTKAAELPALDERLSALEAAGNRPGSASYGGSEGRGREAKAAFLGYMNGDGDDKQFKHMVIASNPDGGFAVPSIIGETIANQVREISPVRQVARSVTVNTSDYVELVNRRGTASGWTSESGTRDETATPKLGQVRPPNGELYAMPEVSNHLLQDAFFDVESFLRMEISTEFAYQEGAAFITGDGIDKPRGFLTNEATTDSDDARDFGVLEYVPSGASGGFDASNPGDIFIDLLYRLKAGYRTGAGVAWLLNSATAATVRKFKDGDGNYLWTNGVQAGQPASLLGYPVVIAEDMPDIAAGSYPVAFGNWQRGYVITDRPEMSMVRDTVTRKGFTRLYTAKRTGGAILDSNAIKLLKIATE